MTEIFVCKPGTVSDEDRAMLRDAGVVVVQMDNPSKFRLVRARVEPEFDAGMLLKAAVIALSGASDATYGNADSNRRAFFKVLTQGIEGDEGKS